MFGISFFELIVILLAALICVGPDKLPSVARKLADLFVLFRKNTDGLRREFYNSIYAPAQEIKTRVGLEARDLLTMSQKNPELLNCEQKEKVNKFIAENDSLTESEKKNGG